MMQRTDMRSTQAPPGQIHIARGKSIDRALVHYPRHRDVHLGLRATLLLRPPSSASRPRRQTGFASTPNSAKHA